MHKLVLTIVFIIACASVQAQTENRDPSLPAESQKYNDSSAAGETADDRDILSDTTLYITEIKLPPDSVLKWKNDSRFKYMHDLDSLLKERRKRELLEYGRAEKSGSRSFLQRLLSSRITHFFFWAVAIAFVAFILYRMLFVNAVFRRNKYGKPAVEEISAEETVPKTVAEYDQLIHQSCRLGDFRMAVRYLFLKTLAELSAHELLHLSADKTNYQYVQEINPAWKEEFAALLLTYEYVWYGNFHPSAGTFSGIEKKFSNFFNKIPGN